MNSYPAHAHAILFKSLELFGRLLILKEEEKKSIIFLASIFFVKMIVILR